MNISIVGWKPGFNKVQFNSLLRECCDFSLSEGKKAVDSILEGNQISITIAPDRKEYFCEKASMLGAIFQENKS